MRSLRHVGAATALALLSSSAFAEVTANVGISNNYLWRGLTQSNNEPAISGGIDYTNESGFYLGTWASNVEYASDDTYSYEHDVYLGWTGGDDNFTWDVGWLYYNYDDINKIDFHDLYATLAWGGFSVTGFVLTGTEADEPAPWCAPTTTNCSSQADFGFGSAYYVSLNYGFELENGMGITLHAGRHAGDFNEYFNGVPGDYTDYAVSFAVSDFTFTVSDTDLNDYAPANNLDNDEMKFVVSYSMEFGL
jgi:uncharacterized protein (TIGR02001 family)